MTVREDLCTRPAVMHGGAIMAFADTLGAAGTILNLPERARGTTTVESKTNFIAAAPQGAGVRGEAIPVHRGRRTQVWQTRITLAETGRPSRFRILACGGTSLIPGVITHSSNIVEHPELSPVGRASVKLKALADGPRLASAALWKRSA